jgi:multidrug efflux pump subunit AcrB
MFTRKLGIEPDPFRSALGRQRDVMEVDWHADGVTFRDVQSRLARAVAHTTAMTTLDRPSPAALIALLPLAGALLMLILTGTELIVASGMGLLLIGLVPKNSTALRDYAQRERERGVPGGEAVYDAARVGRRPILMPTLCTLFGLVLLALGMGAGAEPDRPLTLPVIGGLTLSTIVTLYVIPALYAGLHRRASGATS